MPGPRRRSRARSSFAASALWTRHRLLPATVFSDLLVWGWLRRVYTERQISRALASLDRLGASGSVEDRTKFLKKLAGRGGRGRSLSAQALAPGRSDPAGTARRMDGAEVALIETAALLHDVGKLQTPPEILQKEGPLTEAEQAVMRRHVEEGARLVQTLGHPRLTAIVRHHHERFGGGGYPSGIAGGGDPARCPRRLGRRHVRCDHLGAAIPRGRARQAGGRCPASGGRAPSSIPTRSMPSSATTPIATSRCSRR